MPRDQETSFRNEPASSDDPLFREPSDRFRDGQVPSDQDQDDRDLADPNDTGAIPIGDELTGRHGLVTSEMVPAVLSLDESQRLGDISLAQHDY